MPLTALSPTRSVLDATDCDEPTWAAVHRARPRPQLSCRGCGALMHAKVSSTGLRFFAHDQRVPTCPSAGETAEHRWLKRRLADAVREAAWTAALEAEPCSGDVGGWRADVLAVAPDGRRFAFEAQLAPMTAEVGAERAARYRADGIPSAWITTKAAPWLYRLPGAHVTEADDDPADDGRGTLAARRGLARLRDGQPGSGWDAPAGVPLPRLVASLLAGRVVPHTIRHLYESVQAGSKERTYWHDPAVVLAPEQHVRADQQHEKVLAAEQARQAANAARRARNIERLYERQRQALPWAVGAALKAVRPGEGVWLGVPPTDTRRDGDVSLEQAYGNDKTAQGAVVWVGATKAELRLFAVVCPVASRITPGLAHSWRRRDTRIYVSEPHEAHRVAESLGWPVTSLHMVGDSQHGPG